MNQKGFIIPLILVVLAVAISGYLVFVRNMRIAIAPTLLVSEIVDWKTYSQNEIEFKYPQNVGDPKSGSISSCCTSSLGDFGTKPQWSITFGDNSYGLSGYYIGLNDQIKIINNLKSNDPGQLTTFESESFINGNRVIKFSEGGEDPSSVPIDNALIFGLKTVVLFSYNSSGNDNTFNHILSTFKFTK